MMTMSHLVTEYGEKDVWAGTIAAIALSCTSVLASDSFLF